MRGRHGLTGRLVVLLGLLTAHEVHAWGDTGHEIIGESAF
jgi:hypothetical protein